MPPRMMTAMPLCSMGWPMSGKSAFEYSPISTPATPPSAGGERSGDEQFFNIDAQQPGGLGRFGDGAQRAAELRAAHDEHQHGHQREGHEDDAQLDHGQVQTGDLDHFLGHGAVREAQVAGAEMPCAALFRMMPTPMVAIMGIR